MAEVNYDEERRLAEQLFPVQSPAMGQLPGNMATIMGQPQQGAVAPPQQPTPNAGSAPTPQANPGMQGMLNHMQSLLTPTAPTVTRPENFAQGIRNVFQNTLLRPMEYSLGLRESPSAQYARIRNDAAKVANYNGLLDMLKTQAGYNAAQQVDLSVFPEGPLRQALVAAQQSGDISTMIDSLEKQRDRLLTNDQKNDYYYQRLRVLDPEGFDALMETRAIVNPPEPIKTAMAFEQLGPDARKFFMSQNADEKQQLLARFGNDLDKYFQYLERTEASLQGAITEAQQGGVVLTPGQEEIDKMFAKQASEFLFTGAASSAIANISSLNESVSILMANPDMTGRQLIGRPDNLLPSETLALKENVAYVVTQGMKDIIGSAFAESESIAFVNRTFNQILPPSVNAARLRRLRAQMSDAFERKVAGVEYFGAKGTLKGFEPGVKSLIFSLDDFEQGMFQESDYDGVSNDDLVKILERPNVSVHEIAVIRKVNKKRRGGN